MAEIANRTVDFVFCFLKLIQKKKREREKMPLLTLGITGYLEQMKATLTVPQSFTWGGKAGKETWMAWCVSLDYPDHS